MTDVFVVYSNEAQIGKIEDAKLASPIFHFIDIESKKGKKEGWALKSHWGAKLDPFAIAMDGETPVKAFYSEASSNVINELLEYVKKCG